MGVALSDDEVPVTHRTALTVEPAGPTTPVSRNWRWSNVALPEAHIGLMILLPALAALIDREVRTEEDRLTAAFGVEYPGVSGPGATLSVNDGATSG